MSSNRNRTSILARARIAVVIVVIIIAGSLLAMAAAAATAPWVNINTNDNAVDGDWGDPFYTSPGNNGAVADQDEIKRAWVRNDGTYIYFRLETYAGPALSASNRRAVGAIDCDNDGNFQEGWTSPGPTGDRAVAWGLDTTGTEGVAVYSGSGQQAANLEDTDGERPSGSNTNVEIRLPLQLLYPDTANPGGIGCRGSSSPIGVGLAVVQASPFGGFTTIDDSDPIVWEIPLDYGDLPNPGDAFATPSPICEQYPTQIFCQGARHGVTAGFHLGATIDNDDGNRHNDNATADDDANVDDEDGVIGTAGKAWTSTPGGGSLDVTVEGGSGYLNCWVDWNDNDVLTDANERIFSDQPVAATTQSLAFNIPASAGNLSGVYYARCRLSPSAGVITAPTGPVEGGEVEDYRWLPQLATLDIAISGSNVVLTWAPDPISGDNYEVYRSSGPYFSLGTPVTTLGASPYTHNNVVGSPVETYYYKVVRTRSVSGTVFKTVPTNEVGLFEFALTPGS